MPSDIANVSRTCKLFQTCANDDFLWETLLKRDFAYVVPSDRTGSSRELYSTMRTFSASFRFSSVRTIAGNLHDSTPTRCACFADGFIVSGSDDKTVGISKVVDGHLEKLHSSTSDYKGDLYCVKYEFEASVRSLYFLTRCIGSILLHESYTALASTGRDIFSILMPMEILQSAASWKMLTSRSGRYV